MLPDNIAYCRNDPWLVTYIWTRRTCRNLVDIMALGTIYTQQALLKALKSQARQRAHFLSVSLTHTPEPDRRGTESSPGQPRPSERTFAGKYILTLVSGLLCRHLD